MATRLCRVRDVKSSIKNNNKNKNGLKTVEANIVECEPIGDLVSIETACCVGGKAKY